MGLASRALYFFARELSNSLKKNGLMMFASIGAATLLVFLLGLFLLLFINIKQMEKNIASQMEIHAYLKSSVTEDDAYLLKRKIASLPKVESVAYVDKDQALENLKKEVGQNINLSGIVNNPLPSYFSITVSNPQDIPEVAETIKGMPEVREVHDLQKVVHQFVAFFKTTDHLFLGLVLLLFFCTFFIIYNTIRLGVYSRKKEIEVMQLVGASPGLIRWPFIMEGACYGFLGAVIAVLCLEPSYQALASKIVEVFPSFPFIEGSTVWWLFAWLVAIGTSVGSSGSFLSVNRYLHT